MTAKQQQIAIRRAAVRAFRKRGMTIRQIAARLGWGRGTIWRDAQIAAEQDADLMRRVELSIAVMEAAFKAKARIREAA